MSAMSDYLKDKPKLAGWIGTDEDDLLIAYAYDLRDSLTDLMAAQNKLQGLASKDDHDAIERAAALMARLSVEMKAIHSELFPC